MKLSKSLLRAMLLAVTAGTIASCQKPKVDDGNHIFKKQKPKADTAWASCPACGMG